MAQIWSTPPTSTFLSPLVLPPVPDLDPAAAAGQIQPGRRLSSPPSLFPSLFSLLSLSPLSLSLLHPVPPVVPAHIWSPRPRRGATSSSAEARHPPRVRHDLEEEARAPAMGGTTTRTVR